MSLKTKSNASHLWNTLKLTDHLEQQDYLGARVRLEPAIEQEGTQRNQRGFLST